MKMKTLKAKLTGIAPLIMHNGDLANPLNPIVQQMKPIQSKRKKTEDDLRKLMELEWAGSLYVNEDKQLIIPDTMLEATLLKAAKKNRRGPQFQAGVFSDGRSFVLDHDGPKDIDKMKDDEKFQFDTMVRVQQAKVLRRRPIFKNWSVTVAIKYDPEQVSKSDVIEALKIAGSVVGFGDWRPKFGRFDVEILK